MANHYQQDREDRMQQGYRSSDSDRPRQSEQFSPQDSGQYGDQIDNTYVGRDGDGYHEQSYGGENREASRRRAWQGRDNSYRSPRDQDTLNEYDRQSYEMRNRQPRRNTHSTFRGDDFGAAQMASPATGFAGGYGADQYAGNFLRTDGDYRSRGQRPDRDDDRGFFDRAGDEVASWFGDEDAARRRREDHRGRGPANYTRSDERILEDACDRLTDDYAVDATDVTVTVDGGEVTLDGTVPSRAHKRRAEDCVHDLSGVGHVQNNLRIADREGRDSMNDPSNTGTLA